MYDTQLLIELSLLYSKQWRKVKDSFIHSVRARSSKNHRPSLYQHNSPMQDSPCEFLYNCRKLKISLFLYAIKIA